MDERALSERTDELLKRRWLRGGHHGRANLAARTLTYRTDPAALDGSPARVGQADHLHHRHEWTDEQIVTAYRAQSRGENAFRQQKDPEFVSFSPAFHWTDQKLKVHGFYCTLALMIVSLIERQIRRAGIEQDGQPLGAKLAMRLLNDINEITLVYPPAGGRQGRPRVRTTLAEIDDTQRQLYEALRLNRSPQHRLGHTPTRIPNPQPKRKTRHQRRRTRKVPLGPHVHAGGVCA